MSDGDTVSGTGSASISLAIDGLTGARAYTIRSSLLPQGQASTEADVLGLSRADLATIEIDRGKADDHGN